MTTLNTRYHCQCPAGHPQTESVVTNDAAGNTVCADCGTVLEQDEIVAEVTFLEGSNGGHTALGGRVTADSVGRHALPGMGRSGRNPTYDARQLITQYAHSLAVANDSVVESAHRLYTLAYIQKLTLGKRKTLVCAACLYIALRKERQAVMLIELAELVGVSVFKLGTVFMQLRREFPSVANVDDIDPSVYISRFAQALEFGSKTRDVANDAMLLVKRMQLDWIADGRRPAGICGACLLIAARMHHFHRTVKEIVHVVKMSDSTVIQRLREFSRTPAAQLSAKEFREKAADAQAVAPSLPPSYLKHRVKEVLEMSVKGELPEGVTVSNMPPALVKKVKREMKQEEGQVKEEGQDGDKESETNGDQEAEEDEQGSPIKPKEKGKAKAKGKGKAAAAAAAGQGRRGRPPKASALSPASAVAASISNNPPDSEEEPIVASRSTIRGRAHRSDPAASQLQVLTPEPTQRQHRGRRSSSNAAHNQSDIDSNSDAMQMDTSGSDTDTPTAAPPTPRPRKRKLPGKSKVAKAMEEESDDDDDDDDDESQSPELQGLKSEIVELAQMLLTQATPTTSRPSSTVSTPTGSPARPTDPGATASSVDTSSPVRKRARTSAGSNNSSKRLVAVNERDLIRALHMAMPKNPATSGQYSELDKSVPGADIEPPAATSQLKDIVPMSKLLMKRLGPMLSPASASTSLLATDDTAAAGTPPHHGMTPAEVAGGYAPLARDPNLGLIALTDADRHLSDLDSDPEVTSALITDASVVRVREQLWVHQNRDWMAAQAEIQRKRAEAAKNGEQGKRRRGGRKRKAGDGDGADAGPPKDVVDAVHRLVKKKVSAKVNRESVADLFGPMVLASGAAAAASGGDDGEADFMVEDDWGEDGAAAGGDGAGEYYGHDEYGGAAAGGASGGGAPGGFPDMAMFGSMYGATDDHGYEEY